MLKDHVLLSPNDKMGLSTWLCVNKNKQLELIFIIIYRPMTLLLYSNKISAVVTDRFYILCALMIITENLLFQIQFFKFEYLHIQLFILSIVMAIDVIKFSHWKVKPLVDCVFWKEVLFSQVKWKCNHYRRHQIISSFIIKWLRSFHEHIFIFLFNVQPWKY